jgi:hypothetical protein
MFVRLIFIYLLFRIMITTILSLIISFSSMTSSPSQSLEQARIHQLDDNIIYGGATASLNGSFVLESGSLKTDYKFHFSDVNITSEGQAKKFAGFNSTNLFTIRVNWSDGTGIIHLHQDRQGAPTTIDGWNAYFIKESN